MAGDDAYYMRRALELARKAEGYTRPNPLVGAVIVQGDTIVGEGYHQRAGLPHAEREALRSAGEAARGATLYVTLEPCNHHGRTPPCTEAIIKAGLARVIYATPDPNPHVAGGGHRRLEEAGIAVVGGLCQQEAQHLNRFFFHHARSGQPYVIAKFAMSLDGKIATHTGHSQWITGEAARARGHALRHQVDAILVGVDTVRADNPHLTTRLATIEDPRHPLRVVLDSRGRTPLDARVLSPDLPVQTLIATTDAMPRAYEAELHTRGAKVLRLPATPTGQVALRPLLETLGSHPFQVQSLLVEGGSTVLGAFFDGGHGYVHEVWAFVAPLLLGGNGAPSPIAGTGAARLEHAPRLSSLSVERVGADVLIQGIVSPCDDDYEARKGAA